MYVKDAARLVLEVIQKIEGPTNIVCGTIYKIKDIVEMLADISDMKNEIVWDNTKPNGQDYRAYDLTKINKINFSCEYSIYSGLKETWEWFIKQMEC
jgi:GDP-L-fucose synthase